MFKLDAEKSFAWVNIPHTYNLDAYTVRNYSPSGENQGDRIDIKMQPQKGKTFLSGIKVRRL